MLERRQTLLEGLKGESGYRFSALTTSTKYPCPVWLLWLYLALTVSGSCLSDASVPTLGIEARPKRSVRCRRFSASLTWKKSIGCALLRIHFTNYVHSVFEPRTTLQDAVPLNLGRASRPGAVFAPGTQATRVPKWEM